MTRRELESTRYELQRKIRRAEKYISFLRSENKRLRSVSVDRIAARRFTPEEKDLMRRIALTAGPSEAAFQLGRAISSVSNWATRHGVKWNSVRSIKHNYPANAKRPPHKIFSLPPRPVVVPAELIDVERMVNLAFKAKRA